MHCSVECKEFQEIKPANIPTQTAFWAKVKNHQGFIPKGFQLIVSEDLLHPSSPGTHSIEDDLLILIRYFNATQYYAYVPYGPKIRPDFENYGVFLEELSEVLRPQLPPGCVFIRYDLPWENPWAREPDFYTEDGDWKGPPSRYAQEFRLNFNTNNWNLQKSPGDVLPTNTFFLDLKPEPGEMLDRMKPKTRYNIRLSMRRGVKVNEYGIDKLNTWYALYADTARRNRMNLLPKDYFISVLKHQANPVAGKRGVRVSLLMADYKGEFLAAMFLVLSSKRGTYLYGASSSGNRQLMGTYLVQWEAINLARQFGCTEYDMFGCAPNGNRAHPMHGLYRYKRGFGGRLYHRMGCWDYPLIPEAYLVFKAMEGTQPGYHA